MTNQDYETQRNQKSMINITQRLQRVRELPIEDACNTRLIPVDFAYERRKIIPVDFNYYGGRK